MITITFVIPASIDFNGGIEKTISHYYECNTGDFKKFILQGEGKSSANIYSIKSIYSKLIIKTSGIANFMVRMFAPALLTLDRIINLKIIKYIEKTSDIIYLTHNDYYYLFRHGKFMIWSEHGNIPSNYTGIAVINSAVTSLIKNKLIFRNISAVHLINGYNRKLIPMKNVFCVPNGVDSSSFIPGERKTGRPRLLYVGRLEKSKGIDMVLNVFKNHNLNIELTVVGSGNLENDFKNVPDNVKYLKNIPDSELQKIYRDSDAFIFISTLENFGNVVLEALSSGLYVVASQNLKPRFNDIEKMNFLEYIEPTEEGILEAIRGIEEKLKYTEIFASRLFIHNYIKKTYDWNNVLVQFYADIKSVYHQE